MTTPSAATMPDPTRSYDQALAHLLDVVRPAVRRQQPYRVGGVPDVAVKLNQNESPFGLPDDLQRELVETFFRLPVNRYPTEQPDRLRHALAAYTGHDPEGILVGNGSNEMTYTLGLAFVGPGTPVVLPRPMFALYETMVRLYDGALTQVAPRPDLAFDVDALVAALERVQPALTVVTTPNNPTGRALALAELERIVAAAPGVVVVDEAYVEFNDEPSAQQLMARYPNVLILRTLSKAFGLAGLRLGYLLGPPPLVQELLKARLPFMVDRFAEAVALALLERPALLRERAAVLKAGAQALHDALAARRGVEVVPTQANFVIFRTALEPTALMTRLAASGVLVRSMGGYPELRGFLRVNTGTEAENQAFLAALDAALSLTPPASA